MAIDTNAEKLALMTFGTPHLAPVPLLNSTFDEEEYQVFLAGYPGVLWQEDIPPEPGQVSVGISAMKRMIFFPMGGRKR